MKTVKLFYANYLGKYVINERGEENTNNVPSENIKDSLEDALNLLINKYRKRNILLETNLDEKDAETVQSYIKDTKIERG